MAVVLYHIDEVAQRLAIEPQRIRHCIEMEWLMPAEAEGPQLDETDVARLNLIFDLSERLGVNDEAVPVILHLIDEVNALRSRLRKLAQEPLDGFSV